MGLMDNVSMMRKAMQAKNRMKNIQAAGQSDPVSVLLNGLNDVVEVEIDKDGFLRLLEGASVDEATLNKIIKKLKESIKTAMNDAKKQLEKELVSSTNMDELRSMLGGS